MVERVLSGAADPHRTGQREDQSSQRRGQGLAEGASGLVGGWGRGGGVEGRGQAGTAHCSSPSTGERTHLIGGLTGGPAVVRASE